jgi:hypothetical protein
MGRMLGIAVAEVILHRAQIRTLVGEVVAAGMPEHMRPDASKLGLLAGHTHDVVDGQLLTTTAYRCGHIPHPGTEITLDHLQGSRCVGASVLTVRLAAISRPLCRARLSVSRAVQCTMTIKQRPDANVATSAPPTSGQSLQNLCKFLLDGRRQN